MHPKGLHKTKLEDVIAILTSSLFLAEVITGLEMTIFQWSDMLSDYARVYISWFSFKSVNKFFYKKIKTSLKFSHFVERSCADGTGGGCDGAIIITQ